MKLLAYVAIGFACYYLYSRGYFAALKDKLVALKDKLVGLLPR